MPYEEERWKKIIVFPYSFIFENESSPKAFVAIRSGLS